MEGTTPECIFDSLGLLFKRLAERGEPELFRTVESTLVHTVYALCRENQVQSARVLGVTRSSLRPLLKQHGLLAIPGHDAEVSSTSSLSPL